MYDIEDVGVLNALTILAPSVVRAGEIAKRIQTGMREGRIINPYEDKDSDSPFTAAITPADPAVEDYIGCEILRLFPDVSFFGEEHNLDRVSGFFKTDSPYLITLDPVNGTLYFKGFVPTWDMVLTITVNNVILGALVYAPCQSRLFIAAQGEGAWEYQTSPDGSLSEGTKLVLAPKEQTVQFNTRTELGANRIQQAGYKLVNTLTDFVQGDAEWRYPTHGILTGTLAGIVKLNANLIDSGAVVMIAHEAGAYTRMATFDPVTRKGGPLIAATSSQLFDLLVMIVNE